MEQVRKPQEGGRTIAQEKVDPLPEETIHDIILYDHKNIIVIWTNGE